MKLSVSIITYNHENYIGRAIESALKQRVNFDYEILIGEDDSNDNTRKIVQRYKSRHPDRIRLFLNDRKNVIYINGRATGRWNFVNNLKQAQGEYIALLEGDDYWTNSYKLQKQVEFLDKNKGFSECFHWAGWLLEDEAKIIHWNYGPPVNKAYYTTDDLLEHGNFIPTCSTVFRSNIIKELPDWYYKIGIGDLPLHLLNSMKGKIGFIDERMAVYRRHRGGRYSGNLKYNNVKTTIDVLELLGSKLEFSQNSSFKIGLSNFYGKLSGAYFEEGKYKEALCSACKSIFIASAGYKKSACLKILNSVRKNIKKTSVKRFLT